MLSALVPYFSATAPTPIPVTDVVEQGGQVLSSIFGWITTVANTVVSNGVIFLTVGIMITGAVIGIFGRLLSRN